MPAAYRRAATVGDGWLAPLFGLQMLQAGAAEVRRFWSEAGRAGEPRIATGRYFSLGPGAGETADEYLRHYYGDAYPARADTLTNAEELRAELDQLEAAGVTDLVLVQCSAAPDQVRRLADLLPAGLLGGRVSVGAAVG